MANKNTRLNITYMVLQNQPSNLTSIGSLRDFKLSANITSGLQNGNSKIQRETEIMGDKFQCCKYFIFGTSIYSMKYQHMTLIINPL